MPEIDAREGADGVEKVLADFDSRHGHFEDLCKTTHALIDRILVQENIQVHSVQARVKKRAKVDGKYRNREKDYKCLSDMPDVVGLRIITYYSDEIDRVASVIRREFLGFHEDDKRLGKPGDFGYSALHIDCTYSSSRLQQTEYRHFGDTKFEIQITTILGHAWAEMHHGPYDDKSSSPPDEQRAFHRLAAVLELADKEFLQVRQARDTRQRNASVRVAAMAPIEISPESLRAFIDETPAVMELDQGFATMFGKELQPETKLTEARRLEQMVRASGFETVETLERSLAGNTKALIEYMTKCIPLWAKTFPKDDPSRKLSRGLSVYHLCSLLAGAKGKESLKALFDESDRHLSPFLDVDAQIQVAKEVAAEYGLI